MIRCAAHRYRHDEVRPAASWSISQRPPLGFAAHLPRWVQTLNAPANVADPPAKAVVEIPLQSRTAMIGDFTKVEAKRALDQRCGERLLAILIGEQREQGDRVAGGSGVDGIRRHCEP